MTEAIREALEGIEAAFTAAARRRAHLVRELAAMSAPPALAADHRALVEALLRREAADADAAATAQQRAATVLAEARRARAAAQRLAAAPTGTDDLAHVQAVQLRHAELDATWRWALDRADSFAAQLHGRAAPPVAAAVTGYVGAFRAVLAASEALDAAALAEAVAAAEAATAALERALTSG